ncbi:MAG: PglD-related sugar-binding protein [Bacteroidales bacterium]
MIIVGAANLGLEVLAILLANKYSGKIVFYDTDKAKEGILYNQYSVITSEAQIKQELKINNDFIVAIGHPRLRERMYNKMLALGGNPTNVISTNAHLFTFLNPFKGCIIEPGAGISHSVEIGEGCAIHINCTIGHAVKLGKFVNIGPGANVVGPCVISDYAYVGVGAIILPNVHIGKNAIISAGSLVNRDVDDFETFYNE